LGCSLAVPALRQNALVAAPAAHRDVERQKEIDRPRRRGLQAVLRARMRAVLAAQEAITQREIGAPYAYRQSLVDLASVAELVAEQLPPPRIPVRRS
jgi:hypothetical protein